MFIEMIVYVDVLFVENLILDFIIICATEIICGERFKFFRTLIGSSIGSLFTVFCILLNVSQFIIKIFISVIVVWTVFGFKNKKRFLKILSVFYLTTITFGGASFMLLFSVNPKEVIYEAGHFLGMYPVKIAFFGGILGFVLIVGVQNTLKRKFCKICNLEFRI